MLSTNIKNGDRQTFFDKIIRFCLENKLVIFLLIFLVIGWGVVVAPFDWKIGDLPRNPIPVDAIPDIGENQQIVFTEWMGRSPQDVEDQVSYPLTVALLGVPEIKTIRAYSMFGFSTIYVIFKENVDFYWSRTRILEKLNSLPSGTLPPGVQPALGPDATALGQIFWYTLEGQDKNGNPTGGWDLHELRTIQNWYVRYALLSADGVAEVASVGGHVQEYQVDVDPDAMRACGVKLEEVFTAIKMSNADVGARTIEVNRVEYVIRGIGFLKTIEDIENTVIKVNDNIPVYVKNVARVVLGPALRRGALDKEGAEAVGGGVVVRYGENPLAAIKNVKAKIVEISPGLPQKKLSDGTISQVKIVPFYDRTGLIYETLGTLNSALIQEILVTIVVIILFVVNFRSSLLISGLLPLAVLLSFIAMKLFGVDANIVALSGIAIAIGTMVDMGVIVCENILKHLGEAKPEHNRKEIIFKAVSEVRGAVLTAVSTTVVSFLPVFALEAAEGKLFKPLAFTKTFALIASLMVAFTIIPPFAHLLFGRKIKKKRKISKKTRNIIHKLGVVLTALIVAVILTRLWLPLGPEKGFVKNIVFVGGLIGGLLGFFYLFQHFYGTLLQWFLVHKITFLSLPIVLLFFGGFIWLGFNSWFGWLPETIQNTRAMAYFNDKFPGLGKEFMPPLDEGSFLYMPTIMPHASIGEALDVLKRQNMAIRSIPEVESVVGKLGRAETPLDPAPISMIETIINYKSEYITDKDGHRIRFKFDKGGFVRNEHGDLIPDSSGKPYRLWRPHIKKPDDIWNEIIRVAHLPGTVPSPKLQPIAARIVMLQTGMRAPMGIKIKGPDLETIDMVGLQLEKILKEVHSVEPGSVLADRIVGKPYLEIDIDRKAIARYGIKLRQIQDVIEVAIGGKRITTTVEGRERYPVRVRYMRELRDQIESLEKILVPAPDGTQIPVAQLSSIRYLRGPQVIKSEDTFLIGYVIFDKKPEYAEVDVVEDCRKDIEEKIKTKEFILPAGVTYTFAGSYESQVRSEKKLKVILPIALFIIFIILYFQFRSIPTTTMVFSGIAVAWAGGFLMIWLYSQPWFLNFSILGADMREIFQVHSINLSVAIWVGFLALFGIASDNGVVIATYLDQRFASGNISSVDDIRQATVEGAVRRIRPCLMTSATTMLALIPILTSTGRGSDIMVPMAIPSFGGMFVIFISVFIIPVLYCMVKEFSFKRKKE
ncbi:MAG: efflux RND transporter permease subunit [Desulfobacterales bacterium]|nr:efflux RND transporter permease subunit [Desulfobacterales bacterium]